MGNEWLAKVHNVQLEILDEVDRICTENNLKYFLFGGTLLGACRHKGFIPWDDDVDICMPYEDFNLFVKKFYKELNENFILDYITTNGNYWLPFAKVRNKNTEFVEPLLVNCKTNCGIFIDIFPVSTIREDNVERTYKRMKLIASIKYSLVARNLYGFSHMKELKNPLKKVLFLVKKMIPNRLYYFVLDKLTKSDRIENSKFFINCVGNYSNERETEKIEDYLPSKKIQFEGKMYNAPGNVENILANKYGSNYMELPPIQERKNHEPVRIKFEDGEEMILKNKE